MKYNKDAMCDATERFLEALGIDWEQDSNTKDTPERVATMYKILLGGYDKNPVDYLVMFPAKSNDMVTLTNVPLYTFCSHHLVPAVGKIHIAYVPDKKVVGISKLVRFTRIFAKRLNLQEDLTQDIADCLMKCMKPKGVMVKIELSHFCMIIRGVRSQGSVMVTTAKRGVFNKKPELVREFQDSIKNEGVFPY
jgi:GTP cyclohydrolase I